MPSKRYSFVRGRPAVDARQDGIRRQRDARSDGGEHDEQAAVQRQLHDLLVLDDRAEARGLRSHDRRVCDDRHLFSNVSDAEVEIDARLFTGREPDAFAAHGLERSELDIEAVLAGRQAGRRCRRHRRWTTTTRCRFVRVSVTVIVAPGTAAPA